MIEIEMINTKDEVIRNHAKKIEDLSKQLKIATDFIQYILDQWEIDTNDAQEKAIETIKKMKG